MAKDRVWILLMLGDGRGSGYGMDVAKVER